VTELYRRSYHGENTETHPNFEVKPHWALLVLP